MKKKISRILIMIRKKTIEYISTNRLFLSFILLALVETMLIRFFTAGLLYGIKPFIVDLAMILLFSSLGYIIKPQKQFRYFQTVLIIISLICIINSIYYTWYISFASFGLLATLGQVGEVGGSLVEKLVVADFIYVLFPFIFAFVHRRLGKTNYYNYVSKVEKGKKMAAGTALAGVIFLAFTLVTMSAADYSRITKQWNRDYIVQRFGIILYQGNDLIQSLTPSINSLFGYDEAAREFREFYEENAYTAKKNKYTNIFKDKNVVFVHMESIQSFLMNLSFNEVEVTPNLNKLSNEGMYFNNFYPQISTGTSSDTEFTLLTSLMPALSGTVFVSYYNRDYTTIPKILKDDGYYIFSMHGNRGDMWNRNKAHASLGYDKFYDEKSYTFTREDTVGLGINDKMFFQQSLTYLKEIEASNEKYMGTVISLSNHSPFDDLEKYPFLDLSRTVTKVNQETLEEYQEIDPFLEGTRVGNKTYGEKLGNYIKSSHYADEALGEFIEAIKTSPEFNDTVFVFYGDHDAKVAKSEYNFYYNYDPVTGEILEEGDDGYVAYDGFDHDINRRTPLIIWTKNEKLQKEINTEVSYPMGMYDILPTLGNMMGFTSEYALGHDIFNIKGNNVVIFPNGNFVTDKVFYNNASDSSKILKEGEVLDTSYIQDYKDYTEERLEVSNNIIVYDLIKKEKEKQVGEVN